MVFGGIDPLDWIPRYQNRFPLFHVKAATRTPPAATSTRGSPISAKARSTSARILGALRHKNDHHYIVERDDQPDPATTARVGYAYLRNLRARRRPPHHGWPPHHDDRDHDRPRERDRRARQRDPRHLTV